MTKSSKKKQPASRYQSMTPSSCRDAAAAAATSAGDSDAEAQSDEDSAPLPGNELPAILAAILPDLLEKRRPAPAAALRAAHVLFPLAPSGGFPSATKARMRSTTTASRLPVLNLPHRGPRTSSLSSKTLPEAPRELRVLPSRASLTRSTCSVPSPRLSCFAAILTAMGPNSGTSILAASLSCGWSSTNSPFFLSWVARQLQWLAPRRACVWFMETCGAVLRACMSGGNLPLSSASLAIVGFISRFFRFSITHTTGS